MCVQCYSSRAHHSTVFAHIEDNTERLEDWKPLSWASEETADAAKPEEHTQCDPADCFSLSHIKVRAPLS